jgi:tryptophan synthase alpha chain
MSEEAKTLVSRIRRIAKLPVAVGFGISTGEQVAAVSSYADAAVVGSAIVQTIEQNPGKEASSVAKFIEQLSAVSRQYSAI